MNDWPLEVFSLIRVDHISSHLKLIQEHLHLISSFNCIYQYECSSIQNLKLEKCIKNLEFLNLLINLNNNMSYLLELWDLSLIILQFDNNCFLFLHDLLFKGFKLGICFIFFMSGQKFESLRVILKVFNWLEQWLIKLLFYLVHNQRKNR